MAKSRSLERTLARRTGMTMAGAIAAAIAVAGWVLARAAASRTLFLLVYGTAIVVIGSWLLGRVKPGLTAERSQLPRRVREGQAVQVTLAMRARRRISTVILEEEMHERCGGDVRIPVPLMHGNTETEHTYAFVPRLRGVYTVGPLIATWSDPFGLTAHRMQLIEPAEVIVHPVVESAQDRVVTREWEDPPIRPPFSKPWPSGFEFYGMRDYVPGDDPRRIVWRAAARATEATGDMRLLVREAEQGITDRVSLVLDTDRKHHSKDDPSETFETAIKIVASLGARHLGDGFGVSLDTNDKRIVDSLRGRQNRVGFLDVLARLQPGRAPLSGAIDRMLTSNRRDLHTVIVTPELEEAAAARLRLIVQRGVSLLVALVVTDDTDPVALHRANALGCSVVEIPVGSALGPAFRRIFSGVQRR